MPIQSSPKKRWTWPLMLIVAIGLLSGLGAAYFFFAEKSAEEIAPALAPEEAPLPRMANLPPKEEIPLPEPEYPPDAPVLEQARKALREGIDPDAAVALAASLPDSPERADAAFLLLEYAADSGHAGAALWVGRYYDPSQTTPSGTIQKNASNAYEWYQLALKSGKSEAAEDQARLKAWAQKKVEQGSWESEQLLKAWQ